MKDRIDDYLDDYLDFTARVDSQLGQEEIRFYLNDLARSCDVETDELQGLKIAPLDLDEEIEYSKLSALLAALQNTEKNKDEIEKLTYQNNRRNFYRIIVITYQIGIKVVFKYYSLKEVILKTSDFNQNIILVSLQLNKTIEKAKEVTNILTIMNSILDKEDENKSSNKKVLKQKKEKRIRFKDIPLYYVGKKIKFNLSNKLRKARELRRRYARGYGNLQRLLTELYVLG